MITRFRTIVAPPASHHLPSSIAEDLQGIDQEFPETTQEAVTRKSRNALLPVSRLPPETLRTIFLLSKIWSLAMLKTVTSICSYWREVALCDPLLWNNIELLRSTNSRWTTELLRRSKEVPLDVKSPLGYLSESEAVSATESVLLLLDHLPRIRCLSLSIPYIQSKAVMEAMEGSVSAPLLESLSLCVSRPLSRNFRYPNSLFGGGAPKLRRLRIEDHQLDWDSPLFHSHLTHLSLDWVPNSRHLVLSPLLRVLANLSSSLQDLSIKHVFPEIESDLLSVGVNLPHLSCLHVEFDSPDHVPFLNHFIFPTIVNLTVKISVEGRLSHILDIIIPKIGGKAGTASITTLDIAVSPYTLSWCGQNPDDDRSATFAFYFDWPVAQTADDISRHISYLGGASFSNVSSLTIHVDGGSGPNQLTIPPATWISVCEHIGAVQSLELSGDCRTVLSVLDIRESTGLQSLPLLRTLSIHHADLADISVLLSLVQGRRNAGIPLSSVGIRMCWPVGVQGVGLLKDMVPVVEWDEKGGVCKDDGEYEEMQEEE